MDTDKHLLTDEKAKLIEEIIECAFLWASSDEGNCDEVPDSWLHIIPLLLAAPRLQLAAEAVLGNICDGGAQGPEYDCEDFDDFPRDSDGNIWYPDIWELETALLLARTNKHKFLLEKQED